jgi:tyrosine-protein kinase Etk/Wzc
MMKIEMPFSELKETADSPRGPQVTQQNDEVSVLDLLIVLAERKRTIFGITLVFAVVAVVVSLLLPKSYTATVALMPPQQDASMGAILSSQLSGVAALAGGGGLAAALKNPNDVYVGMLRSRTVEDAMIQRFGLMKEYHERYLVDTRKAFERHTDVDGESLDKMIHISVEDGDPKRAAEIANAYVSEFQDLSEHLAMTEASQRRLFFEREWEQAKDRLADAEEALKATELKTGVIQPEGQAQALIQSAAALRAQIVGKEVQIQGIQTYATGENSQVVEAQQELAGMRTQLAKLGGSAGSSDSEFIVPKGLVPEAGLEYVRKLRDVKYYETIFEILGRQFELAKLDEAKEGAVIQVVDPAVPPDKRSFPKRGIIVFGATFLGLLVGVSYALASASLAYFKRMPETNAKLLNLKRILFVRGRSYSG